MGRYAHLGAGDALWRHVRGGAHPRGEAREGVGELARHAKVGELHFAVGIEEDVRWLDVAVDDLKHAVKVVEGSKHVGSHASEE